jgi:hypothetical protein
LFFAPGKGTETRSRIGDSAHRVREKVGRTYGRASSFTAEVVDRGRDALSKGRDAFRETRDAFARETQAVGKELRGVAGAE